MGSHCCGSGWDRWEARRAERGRCEDREGRWAADSRGERRDKTSHRYAEGDVRSMTKRGVRTSVRSDGYREDIHGHGLFAMSRDVGGADVVAERSMTSSGRAFVAG